MRASLQQAWRRAAGAPGPSPCPRPLPWSSPALGGKASTPSSSAPCSLLLPAGAASPRWSATLGGLEEGSGARSPAGREWLQSVWEEAQCPHG